MWKAANIKYTKRLIEVAKNIEIDISMYDRIDIRQREAGKWELKLSHSYRSDLDVIVGGFKNKKDVDKYASDLFAAASEKIDTEESMGSFILGDY